MKPSLLRTARANSGMVSCLTLDTVTELSVSACNIKCHSVRNEPGEGQVASPLQVMPRRSVAFPGRSTAGRTSSPTRGRPRTVSKRWATVDAVETAWATPR